MKYIVALLLLHMTSIVYSQITILRLQVDKTSVGIDEQIKLVCVSNSNGKITEKWPSNVTRLGVPSNSSKFVQDPKNGSLVQEHLVTYLLKFTRKGSYEIGPFEINVNGKIIRSNTIKIAVSQDRMASNNDDPKAQALIGNGEIHFNKMSIYEGEPVVLNANIITNYPNGKIAIQEGIEILGSPDLFELPTNNTWSEINLGSNRWIYNFKKSLIYPLLLDKITIKPFRLIYSNAVGLKEISAFVPTLKIKPLPANAPPSFFGAVGHYEVFQFTEVTKLRQGDVIPIELTISGEGNLHQLQTPILQLEPGIVMYGEPTVKELFTHSEDGTKGKVIYRYHLQILNPGQLTLSSIEYSYFDLKTETYRTIIDSNMIRLNVMTNDEYQKNVDTKKETFNDGEIAPFSNVEVFEPKSILVLNPYYWIVLLILPGLTFAAMNISRNENVFMEQRFTRFKRNTNKIKETLRKISTNKNELTKEDFRLLEKLVLTMLRNKLNLDEKSTTNLYELMESVKSVELDYEITDDLDLIVEIIYKSRYAFVDPKATKGIIEKLKSIAQEWKQI